jgi:hypothetical protein
MGLFKPDLYRSFAVGFALGAVVLFASVGGSGRAALVDSILPSAVAAPVR